MEDLAYLKALYEDGAIEKLIAVTRESDEINHRLFYLYALRKLGEYEIALSYIAEHQMDLYTAFGPRLIKLHIDTLFEVDDLDQARNVLKQYETFPYFSLETNEVIAKLGEAVQKRRKARQKEKVYDLQALERALFSPNENIALAALQYIGEHYSTAYLHLFQKVLLDGPSEIIRSFILLLLLEKKYDGMVQIRKFDKLYKINPGTLKDPFTTKEFQALEVHLKARSASDNDPNLENVLRNVFVHHYLYVLPMKLATKDAPLLSYIYLFVALNMMGRTTHLVNFVDVHDLDLAVLTELIEHYNFTSFPLYEIKLESNK